jgi:hypothetical protein
VAQTIIIARLIAYDPVGATTVNLRFSSRAYASGPADFPPDEYFEARITQPANLTRSIFENARTFGRAQVGYGELILANSDGGLDYLIDYAYSGRYITIRQGDLQTDGSVTNWQTLIVTTMDQAIFSWDTVTIRLRDNLQALAMPLQGNRYGGTNVLPAGLDGTEDDLEGKTKPLVWGRCFNFAPPCVNTTRLIYQLHDGLLSTVDQVYDRGVSLTAGAAYASQADMETTAPAAGQFRAWLNAAGSYVRLGSTPTGLVTCNARQGAATADRTVGQLWEQVLLKAGVDPGDISAADITALDTAAPYQCGVYCGPETEMTALQVLDMLAASVGAWYSCDAVTGEWHIAQLVVPSGAGIGTITALEVISVDRLSTADPGAGVPAWKVRVRYRPAWAVQVDLGATVPTDRATFLAKHWRTKQDSDSAVLTAYTTSPELTFDTYLYTAADAAAEATRRLTLYKTRRDMLRVRVTVSSTMASQLDVGATIVLQLDRYGYDAGRPMLILGVRSDLRRNTYDLTLWG